MKKKQDSAQLGHVGTFKVLGRDGKVREFKAKTIGRMAPSVPDADETPKAEPPKLKA